MAKKGFLSAMRKCERRERECFSKSGDKEASRDRVCFSGTGFYAKAALCYEEILYTLLNNSKPSRSQTLLLVTCYGLRVIVSYSCQSSVSV